jgi:hypothetical protein
MVFARGPLYVCATGRVVGVVGAGDQVIDMKETGGRVVGGVAVSNRVENVEETLTIGEDGRGEGIHLARVFARPRFIGDRCRVDPGFRQLSLFLPEYICA